MSTTGDRETTGTTELAPEATEVPANSTANRRQGFGDGFLSTISTGWAERPEILPPAREQAAFAAGRRAAVSAEFPGKRLIVPAGPYQVRSNDTDYPFRAHSAFAHLTGWAADAVPDSVLVFEPREQSGHDVMLYFRERADRTTAEFYANPSIGEFWIGPRPARDGVAADLGLATGHIDQFAVIR